jgi:hypothetical protein
MEPAEGRSGAVVNALNVHHAAERPHRDVRAGVSDRHNSDARDGMCGPPDYKFTRGKEELLNINALCRLPSSIPTRLLRKYAMVARNVVTNFLHCERRCCTIARAGARDGNHCKQPCLRFIPADEE